MKVKVSDYIADFAANHNITRCFMITGGGAMHLNDSLGHDPRISCTYNHHEQACAIAAEGYARVSRRPALVCVTSGPGGTNALTGVAGAWLDSIPMIIVSGQIKFETSIRSCLDLHLRQLGDQEFDIIGTVSNMTKYAVMVSDASEIAYHLEKAYALATSGRKGPVWIDVPLDVQSAYVDVDSIPHYGSSEPDIRSIVSSDLSDVPHHKISDDQIDGVLDMIRQSKSPVILAGTSVRLAGADRLLLDLVDRLEIPVLTAWNANDVIAYDHPKFAGMPGTVGTRAGNFVLQNSDLLISLGCRMNIRMVGYNRLEFAKNAYKIAVDIDEDELKKPTLSIDMPICGDVGDFLERLLGALGSNAAYPPDTAAVHRKWLAWCKDRLYKYPSTGDLELVPGKPEDPVNPYLFIDRLFDCLSPDDTIVCSNGSACVITFQAARIKQGQRMFTNSGCASMGYGLPAAIGAATALSERGGSRVVCIEGDGSIMMNLQELSTLHHQGSDLKIILLNNNGYHSMRQTQNNLFGGAHVGIDDRTGLSFPDFESLSVAFGMRYGRISSLSECEAFLHEYLGAAGPMLIEIMLDESQDFAPKVASRIGDDGKVVSPSLEDMSPFLSREELSGNHY